MKDRSGMIRSAIMRMINDEHWFSSLKSLFDYLHRRYPRISIDQTTFTSATPLQRENSKTNIHQILSLFDPALRPKILPIKSNPTRSSQLFTSGKISSSSSAAAGAAGTSLSSTKPPLTFKRLGARLSTIAAFSRANGEKKR